MCTRTVGVLANIFEGAGLATTSLSLVRRQAEIARPPRALHVQFPLGRPLGKPNDAAFQHDVLRRALGLLQRTDAPVLVDHPETIDDETGEAAACPLPPRHDPDVPAHISEARGLRAAYDRSLAARQGRTLMGRVGGPDDIEVLLATFQRLADGESIDAVGWSGRDVVGAAQDVRSYYEEAALELADSTGARRIETWFYHRTEAGSLMFDVRAALKAADVDSSVTGYVTPNTQRR